MTTDLEQIRKRLDERKRQLRGTADVHRVIRDDQMVADIEALLKIAEHPVANKAMVLWGMMHMTGRATGYVEIDGHWYRVLVSGVPLDKAEEIRLHQPQPANGQERGE